MSAWIEPLLGLVVLSNFRLLGGSRLVSLVHTVGMQGALLGLLGAAVNADALGAREAGMAAGTVFIKGLLLPRLMLRAIRRVEIRREVEPLVGYNLSLTLGAVALAASLALGRDLPLPSASASPLLVPVAAFTFLVGLFLVTSRRKAITQVLGYLVFENGIYTFGLAVGREQPLLVELGVLLDLLVAIFVMGIIVFHIQRTFDHVDVDRLAALREEPVSPPEAAR
jgi:hydrogenase-4 component E